MGQGGFDPVFDGTGLFLRNQHLDASWSASLLHGFQLNSASISADIGITLAMQAKLSGAASCTGSVKLLEFEYHQTLSVGIVPVWIDHKLTIDLNGKIAASGSVSWQLSRDFGATVGVKYSNGQFSRINNPIDVVHSASFDATGNVEAYIKLPISYDALVYGITGLGATLEPQISAEATASVNATTANASVDVKLTVPLTIRGTFKLQLDLPIVGKVGFSKEYEFAKFNLFTKDLFTRSWSYTVPSTYSPGDTPNPKPVDSPAPIPTGGGGGGAGVSFVVTSTGGAGVLLRNSPTLADSKATDCPSKPGSTSPAKHGAKPRGHATTTSGTTCAPAAKRDTSPTRTRPPRSSQTSS